MELDDFKKVTNPSKHEGNNRPGNSDSIISQVKEVFTRTKRQTFIMAGANLVLALLYLAVRKEGFQLYNSGMVLLAIGLGCGSLYLYLKTKQLSDSIYSLPLVDFLTVAEKRLAYFRIYDYVVVSILLLVIGTGGGFVFFSSISKYTERHILLVVIWIVFFIILVIFGFSAGRKNWEKDSGKLLKEVRDIRMQLNEPEQA